MADHCSVLVLGLLHPGKPLVGQHEYLVGLDLFVGLAQPAQEIGRSLQDSQPSDGAIGCRRVGIQPASLRMPRDRFTCRAARTLPTQSTALYGATSQRSRSSSTSITGVEWGAPGSAPAHSEQVGALREHAAPGGCGPADGQALHHGRADTFFPWPHAAQEEAANFGARNASRVRSVEPVFRTRSSSSPR
jgi:hypothetical protein